MRRIAAFLAAVTAVAGIAVIHSVTPASAAACVGQGTATLATGIGLPTAPTSGVGFSISASCVNGGSASATGTLSSASCGRSVGTGTVNGKPFNLQTAGSILVVNHPSSGVSGVGNAVADPRVANNSCAAGTASKFLVTGVINGV
jgi:hypothetical protein